eukprot:TRINITY_DN7686_c0_g1_i1.p1 TRINITY_DN7686_c0_g1~~TRINITY_DN7686_c0_g1_i1.p1  ORF type:complete len:388 (-),score=60.11 TRINITY_DN7686_c0_g1_i1:102-1265(-)
MACLLESGWNTLFFPSEGEAEVREDPFLIVPRLNVQSLNNDNNVRFVDFSAEELWLAILAEEIPFAFETEETEEQEREREPEQVAVDIMPILLAEAPPRPHFRAAQIIDPFVEAFDMDLTEGLESLFSEELIECPICLESIDISWTVELVGCGHRLCGNCLRESIKQAMIQNSSLPACPMYQCGCRLSNLELQQHTPKEVLLALDRQYIYQKLEAFVCPGTCGLMVFAEKELPCNKLSCPKCSQDICGQCHSKFHDGSCRTTTVVNLAEYLLEANTEFSESWTSCPLCRNAIFRESGCAHMTCSCRCQFCFYCRRKWRASNSYKDQHHQECPVGKSGSFYAVGAFPIELAMAVPSQREDWEVFGTSEPLRQLVDDESDDELGFGLFG